jgi:hypothetical protein
MAVWTEAIPWIVAAIGWGATHLFSEARERRKEVRTQLDKLLERLAKLEEAARDFHTDESFDQKKSLSILSDIDRIERVLTRLTAIQVDNLVPVIILHRRAITFQNFDKTSFEKKDSSSEVISDINSATQDFEDEIEAQYRIAYPPKFPYFTLPWER